MTSDDIFKRKFIVKVQSIAIRTKFELEMLGTPIDKDSTPEQIMQRDITTCGLTINEILAVYKKGFDILIPDPNTTLEIYEAINRHLSAWKTHLATSINKKTPPTQDLVELDELATMLFDKVKHNYLDNEVDYAFGGINYDDVGMSIEPKNKITLDDITRKPLSKSFKSSMSIRNINISKLNN